MERVLANKANWLSAHGHEIIIVTTDQHSHYPFFELDSSIQTFDLGINYEDNNGKSFLNKAVNYPFKQLKHRRRLSSLLKELKADIVISMFCNDASFLPAIKDGSKKVLEIHFSRFKRLQYGRKGVWRIADKIRFHNELKTVSRFDRFVVLTNEDKSYWSGLKNLNVIPNARSFEFLEEPEHSSTTVVAVGRYCYQKGFDRLIDVWKKVSESAPEWRLSIIGSGELHAELQKQIDEYGIADSVDLRSADASDMPEIFASASICVMTSRYEGLPMVLLEAQAAGLPIVSFDCKCGPKDIIEEGVTGFIVPDGDISSMSRRLMQLMHDEKLRNIMGHKAFLNSYNYTTERVMSQWQKLFGELI